MDFELKPCMLSTRAIFYLLYKFIFSFALVFRQKLTKTCANVGTFYAQGAAQVQLLMALLSAK